MLWHRCFHPNLVRATADLNSEQRQPTQKILIVKRRIDFRWCWEELNYRTSQKHRAFEVQNARCIALELDPFGVRFAPTRPQAKCWHACKQSLGVGSHLVSVTGKPNWKHQQRHDLHKQRAVHSSFRTSCKWRWHSLFLWHKQKADGEDGAMEDESKVKDSEVGKESDDVNNGDSTKLYYVVCCCCE